HAAKGLEWPVVHVVGASDGLLPISMAKTAAEVEEERRLFYVALTRARDLLTVSWAAARTPGARGSRKPSRFLDGVLEHPDARSEPTGATARRTGRRTAPLSSGCPPSADGAVLEQLRTWRRERARRSGAPAYTVFTDATLEAIAERDPRSPSELLAVPGVGPAKVESYGHEVLELLGSHRSRTAE